ncbi:MAG: ribonuclease P protein component [Lachnospiraceae bacterium]|nr:ribonuclease P protein component [Lachnospiraceae bacterium]
MEDKKYTLNKSERLDSKKLIERLFAGGNKSFPAFPLRVVYMPLTPEENVADASILISVPKKRFKHAVKRNRVKRQVREAYRHNKHILLKALKAKESPNKMILAFIWLDNKLYSTEQVEYKVKKLLTHIAENI